jgi:arylsulfatase A-like enzyme
MGHSPALIEPDRATLPSVLHDAGYATGAFGKWHLGLGWHWADGHVETAFGANARLSFEREANSDGGIDYQRPFVGGPIDLGFERFFGIAGSLDMPPYCFLDQDRVARIPSIPKAELITSQRPGYQAPGWRDDEVDLRFTQEALKWLTETQSDTRPFFLYFAAAAPHRPCVPPEFVRGSTGLGNRADSVSLIDWIVGQIDTTLTNIGVTENTLFIITSDNGAPLIYPEDGDVTTHRPNGPFRGQKGDIWEGGHREPFLVRWPRWIPGGMNIDDPVGLVDLHATITSAIGVETPERSGEDSTNIASILCGTGSTSARPDPRLLVHHSLDGQFAIRVGRWKVEFCTGSGGGFSRPVGHPLNREHHDGQLYDIATDPYEKENLWHYRHDILEDAYDRIREIVQDSKNGLAMDLNI